MERSEYAVEWSSDLSWPCVGEGVSGKAPGIFEAGEEKASDDNGDFWRCNGFRWGVIGGARRSLGGMRGGEGVGRDEPAVKEVGFDRGDICGGGALLELIEEREMAERMLLMEERRSDAMMGADLLVR